MLLPLLAGIASADPWTDPAAWAVGQAIRDGGDTWDAFLGVGLDDPASLAAKEGKGEWPAPADALLAADRARAGWTPVWSARPGISVAVGDGIPSDARGDLEPGLVAARLRLAAAAYAGPFTLRVAPEVGLDDLALVARPRGWVGVQTAHWRLGFGKQDRALGPGRFGNLLVSDHAEPPWMAEAAAEGRFPGIFRVAGRFRLEVDLGWLDRPRGDVANPGLLRMDVRWSPSPVFELGLTRQSMFGGDGRPPVDVGQLLVPTEPHVYDDPDLTQPDQNEEASLDVRVTLPLARWLGGPVRHVEAWWEYGGEDLVVRDYDGVSLPALAGVANLVGGEVAVGPVTATAEYAVLMDDYFRWYVGHRVYHDGFTQDGEVLGWYAGGDSATIAAMLAYTAPGWRARVSGDHVRRVCVVEAEGDHVFALPQEETSWSVGADGSYVLPRGGVVSAGYRLRHVDGVAFVPGATADEHRVVVAWSPAVTVAGRGVHAAWAAGRDGR